MNAKLPGGSEPVSLVATQHFRDEAPLELLQGLGICRNGRGRRWSQRFGQMRGLNQSAGAQNERMLDDILEFAHVSGVIMGEQDPQCFRRHTCDLTFAEAIETRDEVINKKRDVPAALSEGWQFDPHYIDPVI